MKAKMKVFYNEHRQNLHLTVCVLLLVLAWKMPADLIAGTLRLWFAVIFVFFGITYYGDQIGDFVTNLLHGGIKDGSEDKESSPSPGEQEGKPRA